MSVVGPRKMGVKKILLILSILKIQNVIALWSCTVDDDCNSLVGSSCASGTCVCPFGTQSVNGGSLCAEVAPYYSSPCQENYQCSRLFTSYECRLQESSQDGNCLCQPGSHYYKGRCWISADHGQSCMRDEECQNLPDPLSMSCKSGTCNCAEGYYLRQRGECRKAAGLNEQCVVDEDCVFNGGACDTNTLLCYSRNSDAGTNMIPKIDTKIISNKTYIKNKMAKEHKMADLRDHGVLCNADNTCPSPFECFSGICVCPVGYYAVGNAEECFAELGSPSTPEQCIGFLSEVQNGICTCPNNFYYADNMKDCIKMARVITDFCLSDTACLTFGGSAKCQDPQEWGLRNCECDLEKSVWDESRQLCRYFASVGEYCEIDSDCYVEGVNVTCAVSDNGGYCACPEGFTAVDGLCITTGLGLGDICRASQECTGASNAECVDSVCVCQSGYSQNGEDCSPEIGGVCSIDSDCVIGNTVCVTADSVNTCQCQEDYVEYNDECWPVITNLNSTCETSAQCRQILGENSICDDKCICPTGYHMRDGNCWEIRGIFETCSRSSECYLSTKIDQLVCRNGLCQCDFKYPYSEELRTCTSAGHTVKTSLALLIVSLGYLFV